MTLICRFGLLSRKVIIFSQKSIFSFMFVAVMFREYTTKIIVFQSLCQHACRRAALPHITSSKVTLVVSTRFLFRTNATPPLAVGLSGSPELKITNLYLNRSSNSALWSLFRWDSCIARITIFLSLTSWLMWFHFGDLLSISLNLLTLRKASYIEVFVYSPLLQPIGIERRGV